MSRSNLGRCVLLDRLESRFLLAIADLDVGFGTNGRSLLDHLGNSQDYVNQIALSPGGKLVIGGQSVSNSVGRATLARINLDGTLDPTFGTGGKLRLASPAAILDLVVHPDGSITTLSSSTTGGVPLMRRYTSSGAVDGTFNTTINPSGTIMDVAETSTGSFYVVVGNNLALVDANGAAVTSFDGDGILPIPVESGGVQFRPQRVAALSDGSVIVGGVYGTTSPNVRVAAFRHYSATGVLDTSFGTGGTLQLSSLTTATQVDRLMLLSDGSLLAAVTDNVSSIANAQGMVANFSAAGVLDGTFDGDGISTINYNGALAERIGDIIEDGNGGYLGMGFIIANGADYASYIFRMTGAGAIDNTFANGGYSSSYSVPYEVNWGNQRLVLPGDGWLYHATSTSSTVVPLQHDQQVLRFSVSSGAQDMSYGGSGRASVGFQASVAQSVQSSTLMPDGGVAFTGWVTAELNPVWIVGRMTESGQPMGTFGTNGTTEVSFGTTTAVPFDIVSQPDGKILIVGRITNSNGVTTTSDYAMARLLSDGSLDPDFGAGGKVVTSFPDATNEILSRVVVDSSGRIYVRGITTVGGVNKNCLMRFSSTGELDTGFGTDGRMFMNLVGNDFILQITPLADNTVLVSGGTDGATDALDNAYVVHVLENGTLDPNFGTGGSIQYDVANQHNSVEGILLDDQGRIYTISTAQPVSGAITNIELRRFHSNGQPDNGFGVVGYAGGAFMSGLFSMVDLDLTPGGRLLAYGRTTGTSSSTNVFVIAFSASNGAVDTSFDGDGRRDYDLNGLVNGDSATRLFVRPDGHWLLTGQAVGPGDAGADFAANRLVGEDATAPTITSISFEYQTAQKIVINFSEHVTPPTAASLVLELLGQETVIPVQPAWLSYDIAQRRLTVTPSPILGDGNYRLTVPAGSATDVAGLTLASSTAIDFFVLAGDANRDRTVDITDLGILATNWQGSGKTFGEGDFNYDGVVDITDLGMLATNWQKNLPAPSGLAIASPFSRARQLSRRAIERVDLQ